MKCIIVDNKIHIRSLEFFLTNRCNLNCAHCAAASPFLTDADWPDAAMFEESLALLSGVMRAGQLKLLGGEPLLNTDICDFIAIARRAAMFDRIRVTTNGLLLSRASDELWRSVDIVEISHYPHIRRPLSDADLRAFEERGARFGTAVEIHTKAEFNVAVSDRSLGNRQRVRKTYATCKEVHKWPCHTLYERRLYRCSRVHTIDRYLSELGVDHAPFSECDGLLIDGSAGLLERVRAYLESPLPLRACEFCFGTSGAVVPHRQLTAAELRSKRHADIDGRGAG